MAANADPLSHTMVMEVMVATEDTDTDMDVKILSFLIIVNRPFPSHLNIRRRNYMLVR